MTELTKEQAEAFTREWVYRPHNSLRAPRTALINWHSPHKGQPCCQAQTTDTSLRFTQFSQCTNRGKITLADGSTWCGSHSPEAVAKRQAKAVERDAKYKAEAEARLAAWRADRTRREEHPRFLEALLAIARGHNDACGLAREVVANYLETKAE